MGLLSRVPVSSIMTDPTPPWRCQTWQWGTEVCEHKGYEVEKSGVQVQSGDAFCFVSTMCAVCLGWLQGPGATQSQQQEQQPKALCPAGEWS